MEGLRHRPEHLAQADRLRRGKPERPHHLLFRETEDAAARHRGAEHAGRARDVPAAIVVRGVDGVANPALDLDAKHHGGQKVFARHWPELRQCEKR